VTLGSNTLTIGTTSNTTTYAGRISGSGSLVKDGANTQVLSGSNTFSGTTIAQEDYALDAQAVWDINLEGAKLARAAADRWTAKEPHKPRFAAGSIGPLNKMLSMSSDVNDPGARSVTFDQVYEAYRHQVKALNEGGVDLYLIETITDTLNCKAAIKAIKDLEDDGLDALPIWISGTITDRSGRTLSGQTAEAFWNSIRHARPFAVGFNCALGADLMRPFIAELSRVADTLVATLAALLEHDGSAKHAAEALYCHRNTVIYRAKQIEELTGRRHLAEDFLLGVHDGGVIAAECLTDLRQ
jgi:autotransporter-associated beta strand protein